MANPLMKLSVAWRRDVVAVVAILLGGGFPGTWLVLQYQQPQVVFYADGYYSRIGDDLLVGTVFIFNEGRSPDTNLSLLIDESIATSDIAINYLSMKADIINDGRKTRIIIPRLKPRESAEIVFRSRGARDSFTVDEFTSDSGNIRQEEWVNESSWRFSRLQIGITLIAVTAAFAIGYAVSFLKTNVIAMAKRTTRKKSHAVSKVSQ